MLISRSKIYNVNNVNPLHQLKFIGYMQVSVSNWCKDNLDHRFSINTLFGNGNHDWTGTPMSVLYENHIKKNKSGPHTRKGAGQDAGRLLRLALDKDDKVFEENEFWTKKYRLKH